MRITYTLEPNSKDLCSTYLIHNRSRNLPTVIAKNEDPLWNHVYKEAIKVMGPLAQKVKESKLGALSPKDKTIHIYCESEKAAQLIQQYDFVFLEGLRRYFPALKELKVKRIH